MIWTFLAGSLLISTALAVNKSRSLNYALVLLYILMLLGFGIYQYLNINTLQNGYFKSDSLAVLMLLSLCFVSVPVLFHSYRYTEKDDPEGTPRTRGVFFAAITLLLTSCAAAFLSDHPAVTWIFIEITTISASVLIYHHRNIRALEGAWKYVFICAISITFIYVGILFLSLSVKNAGLDDISFTTLMENTGRLDPFWLKLSFLFIYTGMTAKLGLVPMYTAGIDAKDKAPGPAGAILSSILMNVGFVGVYRMYAVISKTPHYNWADLIILIAAILSVFVATVYMTRIKNIKRMFAYSGIEHMGVAMIALAAGGIGVYAAILHTILHTLVKPSLFLQYNQIYRVYQSKSIYDLGNYFKYNKAGAILVLLAFVSVTAMPPSALFVSELMVFQSLFEARYFLLLGVLLILLTLIIWGLGVNIFKLLFTPPTSFDDSNVPGISPWESLPQYILILASVYLAYNPPAKFVQMIEEAVKLIQ